MRIVYRTLTLEIVHIQLNDNSITAFNESEYSVIQSTPQQCLTIAASIGLDTQQIENFILENNL